MGQLETDKSWLEPRPMLWGRPPVSMATEAPCCPQHQLASRAQLQQHIWLILRAPTWFLPKAQFHCQGGVTLRKTEGATHPQGFLVGQARPPTPTDDSQGGRRRGHLHSTSPPGNGCARCPLGKEERGTAGKPGEGGDPQAGSLHSVWAWGPGRQAGRTREPPHHRPPCSSPGHWLCGRLSPAGPEAHPGPSGWSTRADPRERAPWSSPAQRTYR